MYRSPFRAKARQTTPFRKKGSWACGYHTGEDWVCDTDKTLVSPCNGTLIRNSYDKSYGNYVIIRTFDNKTILMAHLAEKSRVKQGKIVTVGTVLGKMGNTGNSFGAHLHIEVQKSSIWQYGVNLLKPSNYIDFNAYENKKLQKAVDEDLEKIKVKIGSKTFDGILNADGVSYVPVRKLGEIVDSTIVWEAKTQTAKVNPTVIKAQKGGKTLADGYLIGGSSYVKVRPLLESLGHKIEWNSKTQSVIIK